MSKAIGYIFDHNGCYRDKYYFTNTIENITRFILEFNILGKRDITITNAFDELIYRSKDGYIESEQMNYDIHAELRRLTHNKYVTKKMNFKNEEPGVMILCE